MSRNTGEKEERKSVEGMESVSPEPSDEKKANYGFEDLLYEVRMNRAALSVLSDLGSSAVGYGYFELCQFNGLLLREIENTVELLDQVIAALQEVGTEDIEVPT